MNKETPQSEESEATPEILELVRKFAEAIRPGKEYAKGEKKADFDFQLSGGNTLRTREGEEGEVTVLVEKKDGSAINLSDFLPEGWRFVSPTSVLDIKELRQYAGQWFIDEGEKVIGVGELKNKESILALFHELGHAERPEDMERATAVRGDNRMVKVFNTELSVAERNAWASAIRIMRDLKKRGVNLFDTFQWEEMRICMYAALANHMFGSILRELNTLKESDLEELHLDYLQELFDKGKLDKMKGKAVEYLKKRIVS